MQVRKAAHRILTWRECMLWRVLRNGLRPCQRLAGKQGVLAARAACLLQLEGLQAELSGLQSGCGMSYWAAELEPPVCPQA